MAGCDPGTLDVSGQFQVFVTTSAKVAAFPRLTSPSPETGWQQGEQ
jgi:hypothetical protein